MLVLGGMEWPRSCLPNVQAYTHSFELTSGIFGDISPGVFLGPAGNLKLPIPYTNGIRITATADPGAPGDLNHVFANVAYQTRLPQSWNANLRLFAKRSGQTLPAAASTSHHVKLTSPTNLNRVSGTLFSAGLVGRSLTAGEISVNDMLVLEFIDTNNVRVSSKDTQGAILNQNYSGPDSMPHHEFLNIPSGAGYLAMIVGGFHNVLDVAVLLEGNIRMWLDQNTDEPDIQWTSGEDFANGAWFFDQPNQSDEGGIICKELVNNWDLSFYKSLYHWPIPFQNGIRATVPQYSTFASTQFNWTTFYYLKV
jgi:hypothetical protein